jgi:predicted AlkP superfamily pyrophosphatase or phosphodiesterase
LKGRSPRRAWAAALAAATLACAGRGPGPVALPTPDPALPERILLISVPGFDSASLAHERDGVPVLPTLRALAAAGAFAERVKGVAPASTYPAHATLLTGMRPAEHGVVADRRLAERGVRSAAYSHASHLRAPTLWQRVGEADRPVASLDWPSTRGAAIDQLLPDATLRPGFSWLDQLGDAATPALLAFIADHGGASPEVATPGPARDATLLVLSCELLAGDAPPDLLLVRLGGTAPALARFGPASSQAVQAFGRLDQQLRELLDCLAAAGRLESLTLVVVGDHGVAAVHTAIAANVVLAQAGLLTPSESGLASWRAIARANGGTAFVYARDEQTAVSARTALTRAADTTKAFRVISAEEMIRSGADPEAWFGLEAEPGFAFGDASRGELLSASPVRGVGGYLPGRAEMDGALVLWGRGVRRGLLIPRMGQIDLAPTLARLLGVELAPTTGRALVGILANAPERPVSTPGAGD